MTKAWYQPAHLDITILKDWFLKNPSKNGLTYVLRQTDLSTKCRPRVYTATDPAVS